MLKRLAVIGLVSSMALGGRRTDKFHTTGNERFSDCAANPATCTGNQRDFSFKTHGFPLLLLKRRRHRRRLVKRGSGQGVNNTFSQTGEDFTRTNFIQMLYAL